MTLAEMISSSWLSILRVKGTWHQKHTGVKKLAVGRVLERATAIHGVPVRTSVAEFFKTLMVAAKQTPGTLEVKPLKAYLLDVLRKKRRQRHSGIITGMRPEAEELPSTSAVWRMPWAETIFYLCHMKDRMVSLQAFGAACESFLLHLYNGYPHEPTGIKWGKIMYIIFRH